MEGWNFRVFRSRAGSWIALAKREPFVLEEPSAIREPGDVWFEFGDTEEEALTKLKRSLGLPTS